MGDIEDSHERDPVEEVRARYETPGSHEHEERVQEARKLLSQGINVVDIADELLWNVSDLRRALDDDHRGAA
jgi:hypothetical protein